jgi:hypothetical protein
MPASIATANIGATSFYIFAIYLAVDMRGLRDPKVLGFTISRDIAR